MGIPLRAGRDITDEDRSDAMSVALVNEAFAAMAFPGEVAVGRVLQASGLEITIVGVTGDVRQRGPQEPVRPTIYVSQEQLSRRGMAYVLRTAGDPAALAAPVLAAMRAIDPGQAVTEIQTVSSALGDSIARPRFFTVFLGALTVLTLVLTAVGLYGVLSFLVRRRTAELGIRMALGASGRDVARAVFGEGAWPVAIGLGIGLVLAYLAAGVTRSLLFGVEPSDPWTFAGAVAALVATGAAAAWIPARRAASLDPLAALRSE
jgi:ABC-type antimicrobial peptide transport system permease subunit